MKADIKEAIKKGKQRQELQNVSNIAQRKSWSIKISEASKELTYDLRDLC